jgi:DNA ligase 1
MLYGEFVKLYDELAERAGGLEKTSILAVFLKKLMKSGESKWAYLLKGKVVADYDPREMGISGQLAIKAISKGLGVSEEKILGRFRKVGDLGSIADEYVGKKGQSTLFSEKLKVAKVFENLQKVMEVEGKGAVERKMGLISELLGSATPGEAKYIVRTLLGDLRVGVSDGLIRDAIALAFFGEEEKREMAGKIDEVYDLVVDLAVVLEAASRGRAALERVNIVPGKPIRVMLPVKVEEIEEAFKICRGEDEKVAIEHKYDGFRVVITKTEGGEIKLFTRRLEDVTAQFPDVVKVVEKNVKGTSFILDSEAVGYDPKSGKYRPFEAVSQRIKRKYDIEKLEREMPVEVNVFDILYLDGKSLLKEPFLKRRKTIEKIIKAQKLKIRPSFQIITDSEKEAEKFYKDALKLGEEGIMVKKLDALYHSGRRVGFIVKLKPVVNDLDLVIVGAEYGNGKRAGWLTSYVVACSDGKGEFLEVGRVSSGLKELEGDSADRKSAGLTTTGEKDEVVSKGTTYAEMTKLLKPLITETKGKEVRVKPKLVVSVTYQNIQGSPSYSSGLAMRFPRITAFRPDRGVGDIAGLKDLEKEVKKGR